MGFSNNLKNLCFRKEWDSNPCCITTNILSRDALSTAQPPFLYLLAAGLEPATHREQILSLPCLPISPSEQGLFYSSHFFRAKRDSNPRYLHTIAFKTTAFDHSAIRP